MNLLEDLRFHWGSLRVALEGHSYLDIPKLYIESKQEAKQFLLAYGYNYEDPFAREELWKLYFEALTFIKNNLLDAGEEIPQELLHRGAANDILRLLIDASSQQENIIRAKWCCAILRVMHILSHLDNDLRHEHFSQAREQIFQRLDTFVEKTGTRQWHFIGGNRTVPLVRYLKKVRKERNSIVIKLLSKSHAAVNSIFDSLGIRFVTESRLDAYRLLQALFESGALSAVNIQPGRSVNSLIGVDEFKNLIEEVRGELGNSQLSLTEAKSLLARLEGDEFLGSQGAQRNPFSSRWYRAIQFTCRQLITVPDPTFKFWCQLKDQLAGEEGTLLKALEKFPLTLRETKSFYFPFEIQILDKASYVESIGGRSRHREYKAKQRLMARNRVLRELF